MRIKRPRDLTLWDLPRIESPTLAAGKVEFGSRPASANLSNALSLAEDFPGSTRRSDRDRLKQLKSKLSDGALVLVKDITESPPFRPLIAWQEGSSVPGRWKVTRHFFGLDFNREVAQLNDWQITPQQIKHLGPGGVGHLSASSFHLDLQVRRAAEQEQVRQDSQQDLSLPLGAAAGVAPAALKAEPSKKEAAKKKLHIEVGIFLDGTGNNAANVDAFKEQLKKSCLNPLQLEEIDEAECRHRLALEMGASYANAETNIHKLWSLYPQENREGENTKTALFSIYVPGAGTSTGNNDSLYGMVTGLGSTGIVEQVKLAFGDLAKQLGSRVDSHTIESLTIDIFGFSRGAAAARHAAYEISKGSDGELNRSLEYYGVTTPIETTIRFVGLFDTVAGIANVLDGDLSASDEDNYPIHVYLDPATVNKAVHLTARDECRQNFALNSLRNGDSPLPDNFTEISVPGAHSDVGGGYHTEETEVHLLHPTVELNGFDARWPEETMQWDDLENLKQKSEAAGWVGDYCLPLSSGSTGSILIDRVRHEHPAPDGKIFLKLTMERFIRGEYSRINLHLMHGLAKENKVPFKSIPNHKSMALPRDIQPIFELFKEQAFSGKKDIKLPADLDKWLKQRYIHHSDHFDLVEDMVLGNIAKSELPIRSFYPFQPANDRQRIVHANKNRLVKE